MDGLAESTAVAAEAPEKAEALCELLRALAARGYAFTTPTPSTSRRMFEQPRLGRRRGSNAGRRSSGEAIAAGTNMIRPFLMGLVAGARSITPLAAVSEAARRGELARDNGAAPWLSRPAVAGGLKLLAASELMGDKLPSAPDRIVPAGMLARILSAGLAGAALASHRRRGMGAAVGALTAVGAAYLTFRLRMAALRRFGQTPTGIVEDALAVAAARRIVAGARRAR